MAVSRSAFRVATFMSLLHHSPAHIPVRSRRQAMDLSLVLLSQGIESVIEHAESGWVLQLDPIHLESARSVIEIYRRENRAWGWRRSLPALAHSEAVIFWAIGLALFHALGVLAPMAWSCGVLHSQDVQKGAVWLLFTATTLHSDIGHLLLNLISGLVVLGFAIARFGSGAALLASLLSGAAGNFAGVLIRSESYHGLGASGVVMGALGLLGFQAVRRQATSQAGFRVVLTGVAAATLLFVLLGTNPKSDLIAHTGGFVAGLLLGLLLLRLPTERPRRARLNRACLVAYLLILGISWTLALVNSGQLR